MSDKTKSFRTESVLEEERRNVQTAEPDRRRPRVIYTGFGGLNITNMCGWEAKGPEEVHVFFPARIFELHGEEAKMFYNFIGDTRYKSKPKRAEGVAY